MTDLYNFYQARRQLERERQAFRLAMSGLMIGLLICCFAFCSENEPLPSPAGVSNGR